MTIVRLITNYIIELLAINNYIKKNILGTIIKMCINYNFQQDKNI